MRTARGFSLGELLIVIGILGLLAGILFPVFAQARQAAYQSSALSNLRQVALAERLYEADADDVFSPYFSGFDAGRYTDPECYWPQLVSPYIAPLGVTHGYHGQAIDTDLSRVFFDPLIHLMPQPSGSFGYISSWGLSDAVVDWVGPSGFVPSRRPASESELAAPASTYLLVATRDYFEGGTYPGDALALAPQSSYFGLNSAASTAGHYFGSDDFAKIPATGRAPVAYCDGHVASRAAPQVAVSAQGWFRQTVDRWP